MLLNYHIGRFVLGSLCVGDWVRLGLSSARVQHGHYSTNKKCSYRAVKDQCSAKNIIYL